MSKVWLVALALCAGVGASVGCSGSGDVDDGETAEGAGDGAGNRGTTDEVPCEVAEIVSESCTTCHRSTPLYGAPMPLVKLADFHEDARSDASRKVYELAAERINASGGARMPPVGNPALSDAQLEVMNAWLDAGAQGGGDTCAISEPDLDVDGAAGSGGSLGSTAGATLNASDFEGEASVEPLKYDDPKMVCYEFRAHAQGDKEAPYFVGEGADMYFNFTFHAPWDGMRYARSYAPLIDNPEVVHHWLFYKDSNMQAADGTVASSIGAHPGGQLVHGWAPGAVPVYYAENFGTEMPSDVSYTLELHYWSDDPEAVDMTGIEVCVTPTEPELVGGISWLGTDLINGTTATGTCDPASNERIRLIAGLPHMHIKGKHTLFERIRTDGTVDVLIDEPFDFNYQVNYDIGVWIEPGEKLRTTCTYSEPANFGEGTGDEMCYVFSLHYPKLALTNNNFIFSTIHGPNTCLN